MNNPAPLIVLASTSAYRAELLARVVPIFACAAVSVDEGAFDGEAPAATAVRLAAAKAQAGADAHPGALVIGSDQVAELDGQAIGKPGTRARAHAQLAACSGKQVLFHTAVCLADGRGRERVVHGACDLTRVEFRALGEAEIRRYLDSDNPLDCAGSFKVERLGVALFERIESDDPTALIGLPLIRLCSLLRQAGVVIP
jgi:septum formation protein